MKKKNVFTALFAAVFIVIVVLVVLWRNRSVTFEDDVTQADTVIVPPASPKLFGIETDTFEVVRTEIKSGDSFGKLIADAGLDGAEAHHVSENIASVFDVRKLKIGHPYALLKGKNSAKPWLFIYEESLLDYYFIYLKDSVYAEAKQRKSTIVQRHVAATIKGSLYQTLTDKEVSTNLTMKLADIYAWTIDFFRIQEGDSITVLFEDVYVDDSIYAGTGKILAARFDHFKKPYYAFRYTDAEGHTEYFDHEGNGLKQAFLKAPLQFSRISSHYTKARFHPVQKRWKPHLGTDYAAPTGTPIMTTADGVVEKAGYTSGNGNYVKVRHNSTYSTQYLHMSRIGKGMRPGVRVRQGDVIGYVGSTGLATGPHVCYRFWKNGKQVNPYDEKLPNSEPIQKKYKDDYLKMVGVQMKRLSDPKAANSLP